MARGETRGRRRRRKRRDTGPDPALRPHTPVTSPKRLAEERERSLQRALDARPGWVRKAWATPWRRIGISAVFLAGALWVLVAATTDPRFFEERRSVGAFLVAPALLGMFGLTALEAARDLIRGTNSTPAFFRLDELLLERPGGRGFLFAYGVFVVGALVLLIG